jgi:hypothetical protein
MFVPSQKFLLDMLAAAVASILNATGPVHASVKLATGTFGPQPGSDPASFTEATFTGYAAKVVTTWSTPYLVASGNGQTLSENVLTWTPTDSVVQENIAGYWIVGGNGDYLGGEAFSQPIPLTGPTTSLNLIPLIQQAPGAYAGVLVP